MNARPTKYDFLHSSIDKEVISRLVWEFQTLILAKIKSDMCQAFLMGMSEKLGYMPSATWWIDSETEECQRVF